MKVKNTKSGNVKITMSLRQAVYLMDMIGGSNYLDIHKMVANNTHARATGKYANEEAVREVDETMYQLFSILDEAYGYNNG